MAESHADNHDRDKLDRWRQGLEQDEPGSFPVCAIFLVSESDHNAHDSFREFRDSFESRNAGFHHLVIFGQHGVSTTVRALLTELNLPPDHLPCLVMAARTAPEEVTVIQLPPGNRNESGMIETLLKRVESVIDGEGNLGLEDLAGRIGRNLEGRTLAQVASTLLSQI